MTPPGLYTSRALPLPAFFTRHFSPFVFPGGCVSVSVTFLPGITLVPFCVSLLPLMQAGGLQPHPG